MPLDRLIQFSNLLSTTGKVNFFVNGGYRRFIRARTEMAGD